MHGGGVERRLAEATTEEFFFDRAMGWDAAIIVVPSQGPARPLSGSHHVLPNRNRVRHYFFAQHMASGFERQQYRSFVIPLQGRHRDRVGPLLLQHFLNRNVGTDTEFLPEGLSPIQVAAADRRNLA